MNSDFNILYLFNIFNRWRLKILSFVIIGALGGILKGVLGPAEYTATAIALLPFSSFSNLSHSIQDIAGIRDNSISAHTPIAIVHSKRMRHDIDEHFRPILQRYKIRSIVSFPVKSSFIVAVRATNPKLAVDVANFCILNVDNINKELNLTPQKPLLKILDPADIAEPVTNNLLRGMITGGLFGFIVICSYIFMIEYLARLRQYYGTTSC